MNAEFQNQLYKRFDAKETDELIEIWITNDHVEWSELTFDVVEEILKKRIQELPSQNEPVLEYDDDDDDLEGWEVKLLDDENQPELYDTLEVLAVKDQINKVVKAVVFVRVFLGVWSTQLFQEIILSRRMPTMDNIDGLLLDFLFNALVVGVNIAIVYFPLKALAHILRILMEMEFNSRKAV